jgi:hypothetical protein
MPDVVLIDVPGQDGSLERGAGMYVGHDATRAYFVTAAHVILSNKATKVRMAYFQTATWIDASVYENCDADRDLVVISAPAASLPANIRRVASKDPVVSKTIRMIGHPDAGTWQTWTGSVQNEVSVDGKPQWFSGSGGSSLGGYSGSPVLDADGNFLGIHLSEGAGFTRQLKSSAILDDLRVWGVPVDNITLEDVDTRRFRVAQEMIDALNQDDGDTARANFSTQGKNIMSNSQLTGNWHIDMGVLGDFKKIDRQTKRDEFGNMLYVTALRYEKGTFEVRLLFDSNDQIINFWFATLSGRDPKQMEQAATEAVQKLADGKDVEVYNNVPDSLRSFTSPEMLRQMWTTWQSTAGQFVQIESAQKVVDFDLVAVRCKFANKDVIVQVQFSPSMQVMSYNAFPAP